MIHNNIPTKDELLRYAREDWKKEYEQAAEALQRYRAAHHKIKIQISAYENKLKNIIDPDSDEWERVWIRLQNLKEECSKKYINEDGNANYRYVRLYDQYLRARSRYSEHDICNYFREWLKENGYDPDEYLN